LNIIDNSTSNTFFTQASLEFNLEDHVQPFIESPDAFVRDRAVSFSALKSYLPDFSIEGYAWDFGDGNYSLEAEVDHSYDKIGEYTIKLGITGRDIFKQKLETRCVIKEMTVLKDNQSLAMFKSGIAAQELSTMKEPGGGGEQITQDFSVFEVDPEEEAFRVEVLSSPEKITLEDTIFAPLREDYEIKEFYLSEDSIYSYTVGEYASLLSTYEVYSDVIGKGFTNAQVKTYVLAELPTEIIEQINKDFAEFADANFEFNQSEVSENSYQILDRVAEIMNENPELVMEIAAHTDNVGSFEFNMDLSQKRAESIVNYLTSKGIESVRLIGKGYGESRPIATNSTEEGRLKNRRVEFIILNE
jgi:outer membrane protein OmpA-like peptidoglycan-associated protein